MRVQNINTNIPQSRNSQNRPAFKCNVYGIVKRSCYGVPNCSQELCDTFKDRVISHMVSMATQTYHTSPKNFVKSIFRGVLRSCDPNDKLEVLVLDENTRSVQKLGTNPTDEEFDIIKESIDTFKLEYPMKGEDMCPVLQPKDFNARMRDLDY